MREQAFERALGRGRRCTASRAELERARRRCARAKCERRASPPSASSVVRRAHLKYEGTDTALIVAAGDEPAMRAAFEAAYRARFAFLMPDRGDRDRGALGRGRRASALAPKRLRRSRAASAPRPAAGRARARCTADGALRDAPVYRREALARGPAHRRAGDHRRAQRHHRGRARLARRGHAAQPPGARARRAARAQRARSAPRVDPVMLEVFNNLFMSIAEQMGVRLAQHRLLGQHQGAARLLLRAVRRARAT